MCTSNYGKLNDFLHFHHVEHWPYSSLQNDYRVERFNIEFELNMTKVQQLYQAEKKQPTTVSAPSIQRWCNPELGILGYSKQTIYVDRHLILACKIVSSFAQRSVVLCLCLT